MLLYDAIPNLDGCGIQSAHYPILDMSGCEGQRPNCPCFSGIAPLYQGVVRMLSRSFGDVCPWVSGEWSGLGAYAPDLLPMYIPSCFGDPLCIIRFHSDANRSYSLDASAVDDLLPAVPPKHFSRFCLKTQISILCWCGAKVLHQQCRLTKRCMHTHIVCTLSARYRCLVLPYCPHTDQPH